ncbi:hypothetical protein [Candidatus Williamhamiltonella defendens]|uniref:hypothetical protein n=1 Tax=Candidatus Williamhamiltonella defendens TaxID=138072 RepID=UPI001F195FD7|nr:hypothetical protein [Candidatus Hamiltonella defensa]
MNKAAQPIKHFFIFSVFFTLIYATFEYCRLINEKIKEEQVLEQKSLILTAADNDDSSGTPGDQNRF